MPFRLHVLTAVTRPENLPRIAASLVSSCPPELELVWHWRFDPDHHAVGGQALKNAMLEEISAGADDDWVWCLDDDTAVHPRLLKTLQRWSLISWIRALVVSQQRADGRVLPAGPEHLQVGSIDIGQAILRRGLIGDLRIPEDYNGDGMFLGALLRGRTDVLYLDEVLSFHNALEGGSL